MDNVMDILSKGAEMVKVVTDSANKIKNGVDKIVTVLNEVVNFLNKIK